MVLELIVGGVRGELNQLSKDVNDFIENQLKPEDLQEAKKIFESVDVDVQRILDAEGKEQQIIFQKTIEPFALKLANFSNLLLESMKGDISKVYDSDKYAYKRAISIITKNKKEIGDINALSILTIFLKWIDYNTIFTVNLVRSVSQVSLALQKINSDEFGKANYGTLLSLACIIRTLSDKDKKFEKLSTFIKLGLQYSGLLESYADTIDILCNPDEKEIISKIDNTEISNNKK